MSLVIKDNDLKESYYRIEKQNQSTKKEENVFFSFLADDLAKLKNGLNDETFLESFNRIMMNKKWQDVAKEANISEESFKKYRYGRPFTRIDLMKFMIVMNLSEKNANDLMVKAGFAFKKSSMMERIVEIHIHNKNYDKTEIDSNLLLYGEEPLFEYNSSDV